MPPLLKNSEDKILVYAYGFDKAGYETPTNAIESQGYVIQFIAYRDEKSLENADGVVMPSGIFENHQHNGDYYGGGRVSVTCDKDMLAERQRQLFSAARVQPWMCFLLRFVYRHLGSEPEGTDLATLILQKLFYDVAGHDPNPHVHCKSDEFRKYVEQYGVARTSFGSLKNRNTSLVVVASSGDHAVAAVVNNRVFFLPMPSKKARNVDLANVLQLATDSVIKFKKRNSIYLPPWINRIEFAKEKAIKAEIKELRAKVQSLQDEQGEWSNYKGILCTSGALFVGLVVKIFKQYFGLDIQSEEQYVEDAIVLFNNKPSLLLEMKRVSSGIKREYVNQLDSHRERRSIDPNIVGMLVINDFMNTDGLDVRRSKQVDAQILVHAHRLNVKIMRAITLFDIMMLTEDYEQNLRKEYLFKCWDADDTLVPAQPKPEP